MEAPFDKLKAGAMKRSPIRASQVLRLLLIKNFKIIIIKKHENNHQMLFAGHNIKPIGLL